MNSDRWIFPRQQSQWNACVNVHTRVNASVRNMRELSPVAIRCDMPGDAAIDQRVTSSELPRMQQFWQSTQFLVAEAALRGFRRK